jgi:hypothetical protein
LWTSFVATFDASTDALIALKSAGATEGELKAIVGKGGSAENGDEAGANHAGADPASEGYRPHPRHWLALVGLER